jgi:hypothetical protein
MLSVLATLALARLVHLKDVDDGRPQPRGGWCCSAEIRFDYR